MVTCPNPDHAGSRVVRHGFSGPAPRQRYRCQPLDGPAHTFSLPGNAPPDAIGDALPSSLMRSYRHDAAEIAAALVAIGRGASYRQAALNSSGGKNSNGQVVADWVRVFGPVVTSADVPRRWPPIVAVGAFTIQPDRHDDGRTLQIAVACGSPWAPARLWDARIASRRPGEWRAFFRRHTGSPKVLVTQRGTEPAAAALGVWPASPPVLIESRGWLRPEVTGHGGPDRGPGTQNAAGIDPADVDVDAIVHAYARARDALVRRLAPRSGHFRLLDQMNRLLDLMRMDVNGEAEAIEYAQRITYAG